MCSLLPQIFTTSYCLACASKRFTRLSRRFSRGSERFAVECDGDSTASVKRAGQCYVGDASCCHPDPLASRSRYCFDPCGAGRTQPLIAIAVCVWVRAKGVERGDAETQLELS